MSDENKILSKSAQRLQQALGTPNAVFSLNSSDIESLTHGKIITIK